MTIEFKEIKAIANQIILLPKDEKLQSQKVNLLIDQIKIVIETMEQSATLQEAIKDQDYEVRLAVLASILKDSVILIQEHLQITSADDAIIKFCSITTRLRTLVMTFFELEGNQREMLQTNLDKNAMRNACLKHASLEQKKEEKAVVLTTYQENTMLASWGQTILSWFPSSLTLSSTSTSEKASDDQPGWDIFKIFNGWR